MNIRFSNYRGLALIGIVAIVLLALLFTGVYTVGPESEAVVQRFGKYIKTSQPGVHFKIPYGVDTVTILPTRRQLKLEFGFRTAQASNPDQYGSDPAAESDMVTGDLNAANVEWILQYSIKDPQKYLFYAREPGATLRDLTEGAMCQVIGDRTIDEVLTVGRAEIEMSGLELLRKSLAHLDMGVSAEQIQLKNVHPPGPVQKAFNEVNRAQQEREQLINEANGEYNKVIPKARGTAEQRVSAAEGYATRRINEAHGDVSRFSQLLAEYQKAPTITRQRLYLETMMEVLPKTGPKIILDEDSKQLLPLLNLGK
jgi:modulator of FtsH protease HflK